MAKTSDRDTLRIIMESRLISALAREIFGNVTFIRKHADLFKSEEFKKNKVLQDKTAVDSYIYSSKELISFVDRFEANWKPEKRINPSFKEHLREAANEALAIKKALTESPAPSGETQSIHQLGAGPLCHDILNKFRLNKPEKP